MKKFILFLSIVLTSVVISAQADLPFKMEDITSPKFAAAVEKSGGVCIVPMGIIEKHGPHLPLGTDLYEAREVACTAAKEEYAVVFPPYFTGQIFEAAHQPGAIAYSTDLMWKMLDETCSELARNGMKKIILVNGHGGNNSFLQFFCQSQLSAPRDYIVVLFQPSPGEAALKEIQSLKKAKLDGHAGEDETSMMYYINPSLVDMQALKNESGLDQARLEKLPYGYTGIWWYAKFPNHFASDTDEPNRKLGEILIRSDADQLIELIKYLKSDYTIQNLQKVFFERIGDPLKK
jgi:creatinine amidohydrolase